MTTFYHADEVQKWTNHYGDLSKWAFSVFAELLLYARAPVSQFHVAALIVDEAGHAYAGVNQEYRGAAMAQTVHAEQSALSHAWHRGARRVQHLFVNYTPCGHCRQFLNECRGAEDLIVHLPAREALPLRDLLPQSFGPADLQLEKRFLDAETHLSPCPHQDDFARAAWLAAAESYAPYSGQKAGVALRHRDGRIFAGRYAENAAYNPTLPPLQSALNLLHLSSPHSSVDDIVEALLVARADSGHRAHSEALWGSQSSIPLQYLDF